MRWEGEPWVQGEPGESASAVPVACTAAFLGLGTWGKDWTDGTHAASLPLALPRVVVFFIASTFDYEL